MSSASSLISFVARFKGRRPSPENAVALRPTGRGRLRALISRNEGEGGGWRLGALYFVLSPRYLR